MFDADGVIQSLGPIVDHLARSRSWSTDKATQFLHDYWRRESECGCLSGLADFDDVLASLLTEWGIPGEPQRFYQDFLTVTIVARPAVLDLVRALHASGVLCVLATNQERGRARFMAERLGYQDVFDQMFFSFEIGCMKTDPAFFTRVLEQLQLPADAALFLDDHPANVETARACGLRAELVANEDDIEPLLRKHSLLR